MARGNKKAKAQMLILEEVKQQLLLQAERWGRSGFYTPLKLEEMEVDAGSRIKGDLLAERANLEYELQMLEGSRREIEMKLSRLDGYLRRADNVIKKHSRSVEKTIEKLVGDRKKTFGALDRVKMRSRSVISVMISDN